LRFDKISAGTELVRLADIIEIGRAGKHDNRHDRKRVVAPDSTEDFKPITVGHLEVGHDVGGKFVGLAVGVFAFAFDVGDGLVTAGGGPDAIDGGVFLECLRKEKEIVFAVVNDEKGEFLRFHEEPFYRQPDFFDRSSEGFKRWLSVCSSKKL
jgi:hypothetical protein